LRSLQERIEFYHQQKLIESQWMKKREEESIADACIKDLALKGMKEKVAMENLVREKVAARQMMLQLIPEMVGEAMGELYEEGVWKEPSQEFIWKELLPEMKEATRSRAALYEQVTEMLDGRPALCSCPLLTPPSVRDPLGSSSKRDHPAHSSPPVPLPSPRPSEEKDPPHHPSP
jgi:hypothetical protein